jgi:hypothetical protein
MRIESMLTTEQINDLHRLYWSDHWPIRKIERHLHMGWDTIKKYLDMPAQTTAGRPRSSKLDPYKTTIAELLEKDPSASARRDRTAAPPAGLHRWRQHSAPVRA